MINTRRYNYLEGDGNVLYLLNPQSEIRNPQLKDNQRIRTKPRTPHENQRRRYEDEDSS